MRNSLAGKLKYLQENNTNYLSRTWTDTTRIAHPSENVMGYNTERKRIEFYIKSEDKWYYKWQNEVGSIPDNLPTIFFDSFEDEWFVDNTFTKLFEDLFENEWFADNIFTQLFIDNFENNWFVNNVFVSLFIEDFEDTSWDET